MSELCQYLPWDSNFFSLNVARINSNQLSAASLSEIIPWCEQNDIDCLYFLADPEHATTIQLAEDNQFHMVDIRVTMHCQIEPHSLNRNFDHEYSIRPFHSADLPILRSISRDSFILSRFYSDPCIPQQKSRELYDVWIKNSCEGYADQVLVAVIDQVPIGFITCHIRIEENIGEIGLVGIDEQSRGRGVGTALVEAALTWFLDTATKNASVVTQGTNIPALRLYQRNGFYIHSIQLWYHKWFKGCVEHINA